MQTRALGRWLSLDYRLFNLVREDREMAGEPVKQLALVFFRCEVADQSAFGCVFPEFFYLRQRVLHRRCPAFRGPSLDPGTSGSQ
jgi:hypothetical protein